MPDWKLIAAGRGLNLAPEDLEKIAPVLDSLEAAFRPLVAAIPLPVEPAVSFHCAPEGRQS